jgi:putative transposase
MVARGSEEWFSPAEWVACRSPDLPSTVQAFNRMAAEAGWRNNSKLARPVQGPGRASWQYHLSIGSPAAQARLLLMFGAPPPPSASEPPTEPVSKAIWARFDGLSSELKAECQRRLDAVVLIEKHIAAGLTATAATSLAATAIGVSAATLYNWRKAVSDVPAQDRLAALAPEYRATSVFAECHPTALDVLKSDWLRPERPAFSACYRRMRKLASKNGWMPLPSERALRRRIEAEVPEGVRVLAREGAKKAKTLYPAQQRTRIHLHAMQAFNMDGHEIDVFVLLDDGRVVRMHMLVLQDLYSGKIVAHRLSETENKETVRLAIGDMVSAYGIPEKIVLDNGRAFASKWISGGTKNRYRFKVREGDPQGLLTALGIEIVWARPYSGQSKPIERAFRDLAEEIAKHPKCAGAYTGNRPENKPENYGERAIPIDVFRAHVAEQIAEHNARPGRRLETCAGRSFDETFAASMADPSTIVTFPTEAQRSLWLLAAEQIRTRQGSGEIHAFGNRYWSKELNGHAGRKVVVRFDPDRLQEPLLVYAADDRFLCAAPCIAATGFFDADAARTHARDRGAFEKALKEQRRLTAKMSADELGRMMSSSPPKAPAAPVPPKIKRLAVGGGVPQPNTMPEAEFEKAFSRGLAASLGADAEIIPFPPNRSEHG